MSDRAKTAQTNNSAQSHHPNPLVLWYEQPAKLWTEALPIGNGRLGGMVFGDIATERIQLNEDTLWSGFPRDNNNYEAVKYLEEARSLLFAKKYLEAEKIVKKHMLGTWTESYQPMADLNLKFKGIEQTTNYRRELDLTTATATTTFESDGRIFTREAFVSAVDQVVALRLDCDKPGQLSFTGSLTSLLPGAAQSISGQGLAFRGRCPSHVEPSYVRSPNPTEYERQSLSFEIRLQAFNKGGQLKINGNNELEIETADSVTLYLTGATSFAGFDKSPAKNGKDLAQACEEWVSAAATSNYEILYNRHLSAHQALFNRVELFLGTNEAISLPTDKRLQNFQAGQQDPQLVVLYFQYGRYLLITSSRPGTQPANLQGIWNDQLRPPWSSNYTTNINAQMNYWLAENCNLSECHEPLFDLIQDLQVTGQKTAQVHYDARGWVAHHNVDLWRQACPAGGEAKWAFWPMGGIWLCQHLWDHYAFTLDKDFLANRAYPLMKGAALFALDWLIEDEHGNLITNPSTSPENRFITPEEGQPCATSLGSTADLVMILDLFNNCISASLVLDTDLEFRDKLEVARAKIKPFRIGRYGQLQEWYLDFDEAEPGHRHISHLWGLYPGAVINRSIQPELAEATRKSLERRKDHGGGHTGWSSAWLINLWARLGNGEQAYFYVEFLLKHLTYPNMFDAHPPLSEQATQVFQIDGNFGGSAGIAEMLMQSGNDEIQLLPTLPNAWPSGYFRGLKARGGFVVSLSWEKGGLQEAQIEANFNRICRVRSATLIKEVVCGTETVQTRQMGDNLIEFEVEAGQAYLLRG